MMALRHFTITTADGVVHKCCEDERAPGAAAIAAKVVIMKRDDDEPPSETDVLQTLDDEMRRAFREGRLPITSDGPASTALMHAVHLAGRAKSASVFGGRLCGSVGGIERRGSGRNYRRGETGADGSARCEA